MVKAGDKIVYQGKAYPKINLHYGYIYKCLGVRECGGCKNGVHVDIGLVHQDRYTMCGTCKNIIDMDETYSIPFVLFRMATTEEIEIYNEAILNKSLCQQNN